MKAGLYYVPPYNVELLRDYTVGVDGALKAVDIIIDGRIPMAGDIIPREIQVWLLEEKKKRNLND